MKIGVKIPMNDLDELGILEHEDSLKTQMILDTYLGN